MSVGAEKAKKSKTGNFATAITSKKNNAPRCYKRLGVLLMLELSFPKELLWAWGIGLGARLRQPKGRGIGRVCGNSPHPRDWALGESVVIYHRRGMGQGFANLKVGVLNTPYFSCQLKTHSSKLKTHSAAVYKVFNKN